MSEVLITRRKPSEIVTRVNALFNQLTGRRRGITEYDQVFWGAVAKSLYTSIHRAYKIKSRGGTDNLGDKWDDLLPTTKAYNRKELRSRFNLPGPKGRPTLTESQNKAWRAKFAQSISWLRTKMPEQQAKNRAGSIAWSHVKKNMGARTLIGLLASKKALILKVSGTLENSLSPGRFTGRRYIPHENQIFKVNNGWVSLGTEVEYAEAQDKMRPLWPGQIGPWLEEAYEEGIEALIKALKVDLR